MDRTERFYYIHNRLKSGKCLYGIFTGKRTKWAVLRFNETASRWIQDEIWHPDQKLSIDAQGRATLEVPYGLEQDLVMDVLRHGANVEEVGPASLRRKLREEVRIMLDTYADASRA